MAKKDRHLFIVERSFFVPIDRIANSLSWVGLATSKESWRNQMHASFWSPEIGFWATDGRRAHIWMPSVSEMAIIGDKLDFTVEHSLDIWDNGFVNVVKQEGQRIGIKKVIPEMTEKEKVMSWSVSKRKIDTEIPQIIAKTGCVINLSYLRDLAMGDCWEVFKKLDEYGHAKPLVFQSSNKKAIIMPMLED